MIRLEVPGTPAPKGSGRAMMFGGKARLIASGSTANQRKLASWKAEMLAAISAWWDALPAPEALADVRWPDVRVYVACVFRFPMRQGDLRKTSGIPKPGAPWTLTTKPDPDKLLRSTLDAITAAGCIWRDDAQAAVMAERVYVPPGHPLVSTVLLGLDCGEVVQAWERTVRNAELAVYDARAARTKEAA